MDDYRRNHVPAFGSWDCYDDLPFTQCFESARQAGLLRYSYSEDRDLYVAGDLYDRDLYVAGDLYENDVVTPAMIVVPRRRTKKRQGHVKEGREGAWGSDGGDVKEPQILPYYPSGIDDLDMMARPAPKPVDEDLYKISPGLLHTSKPKKKKRVLGFFTCCLVPTSVL